MERLSDYLLKGTQPMSGRARNLKPSVSRVHTLKHYLLLPLLKKEMEQAGR